MTAIPVATPSHDRLVRSFLCVLNLPVARERWRWQGWLLLSLN